MVCMYTYVQCLHIKIGHTFLRYVMCRCVCHVRNREKYHIFKKYLFNDIYVCIYVIFKIKHFLAAIYSISNA